MRRAAKNDASQRRDADYRKLAWIPTIAQRSIQGLDDSISIAKAHLRLHISSSDRRKLQAFQPYRSLTNILSFMWRVFRFPGRAKIKAKSIFRSEENHRPELI
ncbi:hypothetical protein TWF694_008700 [Orbilia ellipsospora]|uniref:Uncharacterized protein n=1 Tax=Orbilia ellipsospora TaxID=2528407 RepID=A0AAV9XCQ2_9PEZI